MKKKRSVYNDSKLILIIPYILVLIMTPFYGILDRLVFVEVFGCGCVPGAQENMLHINAAFGLWICKVSMWK